MKKEGPEYALHTALRLCGSKTGGTARRWALVTCEDCLEIIATLERQQDDEDARATEMQDRLFADGGLG